MSIEKKILVSKRITAAINSRRIDLSKPAAATRLVTARASLAEMCSSGKHIKNVTIEM